MQVTIVYLRTRRNIVKHFTDINTMLKKDHNEKNIKAGPVEAVAVYKRKRNIIN